MIIYEPQNIFVHQVFFSVYPNFKLKKKRWQWEVKACMTIAFALATDLWTWLYFHGIFMYFHEHGCIFSCGCRFAFVPKLLTAALVPSVSCACGSSPPSQTARCWRTGIAVWCLKDSLNSLSITDWSWFCIFLCKNLFVPSYVVKTAL